MGLSTTIINNQNYQFVMTQRVLSKNNGVKCSWLGAIRKSSALELIIATLISSKLMPFSTVTFLVQGSIIWIQKSTTNLILFQEGVLHDH
jgi:hypothetical protein